MIQIIKQDAPEVLTTLGVAEAAAHCVDFSNEPDAYRTGKKKLSIKKAIYGDDTVLEALRTAQFGKCCFCEVRIETPYMDEHVEHWRPKGSVKQQHGKEEFRPGYYWLAYDWDNLFLACQVCNRNHKGTQFPVVNPATRARTHLDIAALAQEQPLILKPDGALDPETHIIWREDVPEGISPEGEMTIKILGLVRDLDSRRGQTLTDLRRALERLRQYGADPSPSIQDVMDEKRALLRGAILPNAPHSAMAKAFLAANEPWDNL